MAVNVSVQNLKRNEGAYRTGARTGLLAGVTTGSATNGHIWVARWAPTQPGSSPSARPQFALIQRLRARWFTIAGFTAAQEVSLSLYRLTAYTVAHSGGTGAAALTPSPKRSKFWSGQPAAPQMTGRIAGTDQLTAGTQTLDTDPIAGGSYAELAAAATVAKGAFELYLSTEDLAEYPIILANNEGLLLRNEIAMGAGGTARVVVEMDWLELERY